ncbi:hypothetical protein MIR68_006909 [Amoeboaphelidium protococcarum]|nr:hypothetical protein MIR68_006909 [Amoeboaphelidium protococcarum]
MIHKQGFPPLGRRCFAGSSSSLNQGKVAEEQLSEFQLRFEQVRGDLPMFKETFQFDLDKCWLWNLYKSGDFAEIWKDEGNIHEYVSNALIYVRRAFEDSLGLVSRLIISKQQLIAKSKPDVVIIASDSLQIIGACEIKVPQKSQYQCNGFESSTRSVSSQFTNVRDALSVWRKICHWYCVELCQLAFLMV